MELQHTIKGQPQQVWPFLSDFNAFGKIHPVIYRVEKTGPHSYKAYEKLKWGMVTFSFSYPVWLIPNFDTQVVEMHARVFWVNKIALHFAIVQNQGQTIVQEEVNFKLILPLHKLAQRIFKAQHLIVFENLNKALQK